MITGLERTPDFLRGYLREQLQDRRKMLEAANRAARPEYVRLFSEVDAAIAELEHGDLGHCHACDGHVEPERLIANPLEKFCLGCLTPPQQRALEDDLELAGLLQRKMLPPAYYQNGAWEFAYHYEPLGAVSGDYCDLIETVNGEIYFMLGDVAGKGMAASLLMSNLHAMFRALAPLGLPLKELVGRVNRLFSESTPATHFVTMICVKANQDGEAEIANAGHLPPIYWQNGTKTALDPGGLPMGMFCETSFEVSSLRFAPGDSLLLYTDGVTEASDPAGEEYGFERLAAELNGDHKAPLQGQITGILSRLEKFRGNAPRNDDMSIMQIRFG